MADEWTTEVTIKVNPKLHQHLAHAPGVVAAITDIAAHIAGAAGRGHTPGDFGVIVQNRADTKRARAFALPTNSGGIHLELTQHLLVKAAASSGHKKITSQPSSQAAAMGRKNGDSAGTVVGDTIQPSQIKP